MVIGSDKCVHTKFQYSVWSHHCAIVNPCRGLTSWQGPGSSTRPASVNGGKLAPSYCTRYPHHNCTYEVPSMLSIRRSGYPIWIVCKYMWKA